MIIVTKLNCQELICKFIDENNMKINNYFESVPSIYLGMLKKDYCFTLDRELLKSILVDICYKYSNDDVFNQSMVLEHSLGFEEDSDDDSDDEGDKGDKGDVDNIDLGLNN